MVVEIAEVLRKPATLISKHIARLLKAGALERNRAGLYSIPRRFLPSPGNGLVDFGHCLLRLPPAN